MRWLIKPFDALTPHELYQILRLRSEVFVVEQNCVFLDMDDKDAHCEHLMAWNEVGQLVAYTRLVPPGISYNEPSIGRVVTSPAQRGLKIGRELMERSIASVEELFGKQPIKIGAQLYLKRFYESLGFMQSDEEYLEDGIPHIEMVRG
ncbi:MAG: GNAT family N-acetyltransferase [Spirosomataceae bacterium]